MGRPKVSNLRDMRLKVYFTATEYECLARRAKAAGMRLTPFCRAEMLRKTNAQRSDQNEQDNLVRLDYLALRSLGNDLNQMVRHVYRTDEPAPVDLEPLLADIRQVVNRVVQKWF